MKVCASFVCSIYGGSGTLQFFDYLLLILIFFFFHSGHNTFALLNVRGASSLSNQFRSDSVLVIGDEAVVFKPRGSKCLSSLLWFDVDLWFVLVSLRLPFQMPRFHCIRSHLIVISSYYLQFNFVNWLVSHSKTAHSDQKVEFAYEDLADWNAIDNDTYRQNDSGLQCCKFFVLFVGFCCCKACVVLCFELLDLNHQMAKKLTWFGCLFQWFFVFVYWFLLSFSLISNFFLSFLQALNLCQTMVTQFILAWLSFVMWSTLWNIFGIVTR